MTVPPLNDWLSTGTMTVPGYNGPSEVGTMTVPRSNVRLPGGMMIIPRSDGAAERVTERCSGRRLVGGWGRLGALAAEIFAPAESSKEPALS
jgi:hypothetical protein